MPRLRHIIRNAVHGPWAWFSSLCLSWDHATLRAVIFQLNGMIFNSCKGMSPCRSGARLSHIGPRFRAQKTARRGTPNHSEYRLQAEGAILNVMMARSSGSLFSDNPPELV